jgi:hypothetical protein
MAPEVEDKHVQLTTKADIYSFGIMMWVLLTGKLQVYDPSIKHPHAEVVLNGLRPTVPYGNDDLIYKGIMQRYSSSTR